MNVAKWLLLGLLALPLAELIVFIAVAAAYGFLMALTLVIAGSFAGGLVLRYAGSNHIARVRVAMNEGLGQGRFTALQADSHGGILLIAGILLIIPGLITDFLGLLMLLAAFWRSLTGPSGNQAAPARADGVLDLDPEQWHRVDDPALNDRDGRPGNPPKLR